MPKDIVFSPRVARPTLPMSQATRIGNLFFAASVSIDVDGEIVGRGDIRAQVRQTLENLAALLEAAGGSLADVAKTTVYLVDWADYEGMNEVYATYFPVDPPARATLQAGLAFDGLLVEIDVVAGLS